MAGPGHSDSAGRDARPSPIQDGSINLTELAAAMTWSDACETLRIWARTETAELAIEPLDEGETGHADDGYSDTVYFINSGYGVLRCHDRDMECTAGDLLFIPRGNPHRFDRMNGDIRIWRIRLIPHRSGDTDANDPS
jgi:mannose-6-phosphate isomerase-like protein (cupin superfamily)